MLHINTGHGARIFGSLLQNRLLQQATAALGPKEAAALIAAPQKL